MMSNLPDKALLVSVWIGDEGHTFGTREILYAHYENYDDMLHGIKRDRNNKREHYEFWMEHYEISINDCIYPGCIYHSKLAYQDDVGNKER